jgi:hypothetical protein
MSSTMTRTGTTLEVRRTFTVVPAVSLALVALMAGSMVGTAGCGSRAEKEGQLAWKPLVKALREASRRRSNGVLDLREMMRFDWDRLIVLPPYSTAELVSSKLGFSWDGWKKSISQVQDQYVLLVFVSGQEVAAWLDLPSDRGDFQPLIERGYIPRTEAVFTVKRREAEGRPPLILPRSGHHP